MGLDGHVYSIQRGHGMGLGGMQVSNMSGDTTFSVVFTFVTEQQADDYFTKRNFLWRRPFISSMLTSFIMFPSVID